MSHYATEVCKCPKLCGQNYGAAASAMTVGTGATAISDSRWSERNIRYDLDGNLLHLERYQEMVTDNGFIQWNGSAASSRMQYFYSLPYKRSAGETILLCGNEK